MLKELYDDVCAISDPSRAVRHAMAAGDAEFERIKQEAAKQGRVAVIEWRWKAGVGSWPQEVV